MAAIKTVPRSVLKRFLIVIAVVAVPLWVYLVVQPFFAFKHDIREYESEYTNRKKEEIKGRVEHAIALLKYNRAFAGRFESSGQHSGKGENADTTETRIQEEAVNWFNNMSYGKGGYLFVFEYGGTCIAHGANTKFIGMNFSNDEDTNGVKINWELERLAKQGGGFLGYLWEKPGTDKKTRKLGYAQIFEPWGWIICTGVYLDDIEQVVAAKRGAMRATIRKNMTVLGLVLLVAVLVSLLIAIKFSQKLRSELAVFRRFFIESGEFHQTIDSEQLGYDEFRVLAQSGNQMVAAREQAEEELLESEESFKQLAGATWEAIVIHEKGVILEANQQYFDMFGYRPEELLGQEGISRTSTPESIEIIRQQVAEGNLGPYKAVGKRKDGSEFPMDIRIRVLDYHGREVRVAAIRDVTDREKAEEARISHLRHLEKIARIDRVIQQAVDIEQMMSEVLQTTLEMFGCDRVWLLYPCDPDAESWRVPMEQTRPEYPGAFAMGEEIPMLPEVADLFRKTLDKNDLLTLDYRDPDAPRETDNRFSTLSQMHLLIRPRTGKPWTFGIHQCSHHRNWTDEEKSLFREIGHRLGDALSSLLFLRDLRKREADLREAQRIAHIGNWSHTISDNNIQWSDELFKIMGIAHQEVSHELVMKCVHPDDYKTYRDLFRGAGEGVTSNEIEFRIVRPDGTVRHVHDHWNSERDENGKEIRRFGTIQDITELKRATEERLSLERQVQHAQKLESLGVLAGGIAHDFNNILMAILGNADLALAEISPMSPARGNLQAIEKSARRAAELAQQILAYSGKGKFVIEPIDLGELVKEMTHLLEVSISKKAALKYNLADNLPAFDGDVTQIRQIVMNLITNASEAVGKNTGIISLSTGSMECDNGYLNDVNEVLRAGLDEPLPEGAYVYLEVADTGSGMDAETIGKIFDPFFTTKFTGRGLGMSAVLGIVHGHKGALKVYSEVGKGTTFKILFPVNELPDSDIAVRKKDAADGKDWRGSGTILIVDDEEAICDVGKAMLEHLNFDVLTALDGREGVKVFREHAGEIACVLLDLTMPNMNGEQTFRELRRINAHARVILSSGYNEQDATQHFTGKGLAGFIQKPFTIATLGEKLREVL